MTRGSVQMVVFDLGGVLVKVDGDWRSIGAALGIATPSLGECSALEDCPGHLDYQDGATPYDDYLRSLAEFCGCSIEQANRLHMGILGKPYDGTAELLADIRSSGLATGCLSNTNAAHWDLLLDPNVYPVVSSLERKMASHLEGLAKPDPEIFRRYARIHGVPPEGIVFFDDKQENVDSAASVGFRAYRIDPALDPARQERQILVDLGLLKAPEVA